MHRRTKVLIGIGATLTLAVGAALLALPWYVKRKVIEEAAARHVTLAIDDVRVRPGVVTLSGVTATSLDVPGTTVTSPSVSVDLDGTRPTSIRVDGAKVAVDGDVQVVLPAFDRLATAQPTGAAGGPAPPKVHFEDAAVEWKRASGANSVVRVDGFSGDVGGAPLGAELNVAGVLTFELGASKMGPWPFTRSRDAKGLTTTIVLSPKGEAQAHIRFFHSPDTGGTLSSATTELKVASLTRLMDLGFSEPVLSVYAIEGVSVKIDLVHEETATRAKGTVRELQVQGVKLRGAVASLPLAVTGLAYDGPLQKMPVTGGTVTVGPFTGPITGSFGRPPGGLVCELAATSTVMPCADALREQTRALTGPDVAAGLEALARLLGAEQAVGGEVQVHAEVSFDSRHLAASRAQITPSAKCDLSFLPR